MLKIDYKFREQRQSPLKYFFDWNKKVDEKFDNFCYFKFFCQNR